MGVDLCVVAIAVFVPILTAATICHRTTVALRMGFMAVFRVGVGVSLDGKSRPLYAFLDVIPDLKNETMAEVLHRRVESWGRVAHRWLGQLRRRSQHPSRGPRSHVP